MVRSDILRILEYKKSKKRKEREMKENFQTEYLRRSKLIMKRILNGNIRSWSGINVLFL